MWRTHIFANHQYHSSCECTKYRDQKCQNILILKIICASWYLPVRPWHLPSQKCQDPPAFPYAAKAPPVFWYLDPAHIAACLDTIYTPLIRYRTVQTQWGFSTWRFADYWRAVLSVFLFRLELDPVILYCQRQFAWHMYLWYFRGMLWCMYHHHMSFLLRY